jgi:hypothetical protein
MKMEQTQCSETSAINHHTPENNPKGYTRHSEHGESLKSGVVVFDGVFGKQQLHRLPANLTSDFLKDKKCLHQVIGF